MRTQCISRIMQRISLGLLILAGMYAQANGMSSEQRSYYIGVIDGNYAIQMDIISQGDDVSGSYYYQDIGVDIILTGRLYTVDTSRGTVLHLLEQSSEGEIQGYFLGNFEPFAYDLTQFQGHWLSADGNIMLEAQLEKVADYRRLELQHAPLLQASVSYPYFRQVAAQSLNAPLHAAAFADVQAFIEDSEAWLADAHWFSTWELWQEQRIHYYDGSLLSLFTTYYSYMGGAHGNTGYSSQLWTFDQDGSATQLELSDLFRSDSNYYELLQAYLLTDLREQQAAWLIDDRTASVELEQLVFSLSPAGLRFAFAPYDVGPYAQGSFFVTVPYEAVREAISQDSPLQRFLF